MKTPLILPNDQLTVIRATHKSREAHYLVVEPSQAYRQLNILEKGARQIASRNRRHLWIGGVLALFTLTTVAFSVTLNFLIGHSSRPLDNYDAIFGPLDHYNAIFVNYVIAAMAVVIFVSFCLNSSLNVPQLTDFTEAVEIPRELGPLFYRRLSPQDAGVIQLAQSASNQEERATLTGELISQLAAAYAREELEQLQLIRQRASEMLTGASGQSDGTV